MKGSLKVDAVSSEPSLMQQMTLLFPLITQTINESKKRKKRVRIETNGMMRRVRIQFRLLREQDDAELTHTEVAEDQSAALIESDAPRQEVPEIPTDPSALKDTVTFTLVSEYFWGAFNHLGVFFVPREEHCALISSKNSSFHCKKPPKHYFKRGTNLKAVFVLFCITVNQILDNNSLIKGLVTRLLFLIAGGR